MISTEKPEHLPTGTSIQLRPRVSVGLRLSEDSCLEQLNHTADIAVPISVYVIADITLASASIDRLWKDVKQALARANATVNQSILSCNRASFLLGWLCSTAVPVSKSMFRGILHY
jgi:hypothetical protein